jgi:hypothetical protein
MARASTTTEILLLDVVAAFALSVGRESGFFEGAFGPDFEALPTVEVLPGGDPPGSGRSGIDRLACVCAVRSWSAKPLESPAFGVGAATTGVSNSFDAMAGIAMAQGAPF